jgi:hypothetical protein
VVISVDSVHPEIECSQEGLDSQVIDAMEVDAPADPGDDAPQERHPRLSSRIAAQPNAAARIEDRARQIAEARNLSGTNLNSENSFSVLDNDSIYTRALEMGVDPSTFSLENVDCLKDLEIARHQLDRKQQEKSNESEDSNQQDPLLLGFGEETTDDEGFTPVLSRKTRKAMRSASKVRIGGKNDEGSVRSRRAQSKSSAASVKAHNNHPLCDIMAGSRVRKKNPKYL